MNTTPRIGRTAFPIDGNGMPTSEAAFHVIQFLFHRHRDAFATQQIADQLNLPHRIVLTICRQLSITDLLVQQNGIAQYRYNINSENGELQDRVERALIDFPRVLATNEIPRLPDDSMGQPRR